MNTVTTSMKKAFLAAGLTLSVFVIVSCNNTAKTQQDATDEPASADSIYATRHVSEGTAVFEGVYTGTLPCADCEGIDTELAVNTDNTFVIRTRYIGKKATIFGVKGTYSWNSEHTIITLTDVKDGPNQYLVGENTLTQLDMAGNKITGELAAKYVLKK